MGKRHSINFKTELFNEIEIENSAIGNSITQYVNGTLINYRAMCKLHRPDLTRDEWLVVFTAFKGHPKGAIEEEINMIPFMISQVFDYDDDKAKLIEKINKLSEMQRMSLIEASDLFWGGGFTKCYDKQLVKCVQPELA